jgi:hypothetical protein
MLTINAARNRDFEKRFLVFTLIFVFLLWSSWHPLLFPVFGVCSAPVVRADTAPQPKPQRRPVKHSERLASTPAPVKIPAEPSVQAASGDRESVGSESHPQRPCHFSESVMGIPGGIEVRDWGNRDSGGPWIDCAVTETIGGGHLDGHDGGRPGYSPLAR